MGTKKQVAKVLFPLMADWDWASKEDYKKDWKKFRSNMDKMWDQFQDLQKASKDTARKQWEKVFPRFMEMQQTVADALPDEKVSLPGMPLLPWVLRRCGRFSGFPFHPFFMFVCLHASAASFIQPAKIPWV